MRQLVSSLFYFPLHRRHSFVVQSAEELLCVSGEDANVFWRARMTELAAELRGNGLDTQEVREQLYAFHDAVQQEILKRGTRVRGGAVST